MASLLLFSLLASRYLTYGKALKLLLFAYTRDPKGGYTVPASTLLAVFNLMKGELLFAPMVWSLKTPYPGANSWVSKSTLAPPGPDYKMGAHNDLIPLVA